MLLKPGLRRMSPAAALLLACLVGAALAQAVLLRLAPGDPPVNRFGFSPIFWYLLAQYDGHANLLLAALAVAAFLLRGNPAALALVRAAGAHPWRVAAATFVLFCAGSLTVYRAYPLSMDEYVPVFQAGAFAAGRLGGHFPPELLHALLPRHPPNYFLTASRATGEIAGTYWPGFALLLTPFVWIGAPWAANPVISALTLPAVHRLARRMGGSQEAAGWAVLLTLASPVFVVSALSFYSMPAHLLCSVAFADLLLRPTPGRALAAGLVGGLALNLHNPVPHLLFAIPVLAWLAWSRPGVAVLAALAAGYLPFVALGFAWSQHLAALASGGGATAAGGIARAAVPLFERFTAQLDTLLAWPGTRTYEARLAGLSKVWTWAATGLPVLAALGYVALRRDPARRAFAAALGGSLALTFVGYYLVPVDQGHGWGYRYLHAVWFALPLFGAFALDGAGPRGDAALRATAAWMAGLSLLAADGLRLVQVDGFIARHLAQVPPLARAADAGRPEILFISPNAGFYTRDMVHNDPFLRGPRITMVYDGAERAAALMARRFPGYRRAASGPWGELWTEARTRG